MDFFKILSKRQSGKLKATEVPEGHSTIYAARHIILVKTTARV